MLTIRIRQILALHLRAFAPLRENLIFSSLPWPNATAIDARIPYPVHKLKILPIPAGEGSGEAYVREQYPIQVKTLRSRMQYQDLALIVVIDGDDRTVAERQQQFADRLAAATLDPRVPAEKIIHLIPCRNIETRIEYLGDITKTIDEATKYPKLTGRERECQRAVEELARLCKSHPALPANCPASLAAAISELKRLG